MKENKKTFPPNKQKEEEFVVLEDNPLLTEVEE